MGKIFVAIYKFIRRFRPVVFAIVVAFIVFALFNIRNITFFDDFSAVFPQSDEIEIYNEVISNSTFLDQIVFNVYQKDTLLEADPVMLTSVASELTDSIGYYLKPGYVRSITSGADEQLFLDAFELFYHNIPFYLDSADYRKLDTLLTYEGIESKMEQNFRSLISPVSMVTRDFLLYDPLHIVMPRLEILKDVQLEEGLEVYNNFLITADKRNVLFFVLPHDAHSTAENEHFVSELERITKDFEKVHPEIKIDFYGSVPVAIANTRQIKDDIKLTVSIAFVLLVFLMLFFFQRVRSILLIFVPAVVGGIMALLFFAVFKPEISALSLAIGSVLLGITVDFSLHFLTHHKHSGLSEKTLKAIAEPVMISGFTTTTAFLCLVLITSPALRDLAVFASVAVIGAAIGALIFIPQLVKNKQYTEGKLYRRTFIEKIAEFEFQNVKPLVITILVVSVFLLYFTQYTGFEENIEESGYMTEELAAADKRLKQISDVTETTVYVMAEGKTLDESLEHNRKIVGELQKLQGENVFEAYYSVSRIIPSKKIQKENIGMWEDFWTDERISEVKQYMRKAGGKFHFNEKAYQGFFRMIEKDYDVVSPEELAKKMELITENFIIHTPNRVMVANLIRAGEEEIKKAVNKHLSGKENTLVFDKRSIAQSLFELLKNDFNRFIGVSLLVVFLIILFFLGRIELAAITFLPMALSWGWTIGIMGLFDIKFNIFNVIISAFIFGLGIDYSIFVTKGLLHRYKFGSKNIISYKSSILLSCISTLIGLGVLILAKHPALKSIALLSVIGISSVVLIAFTVQPLLFDKLFYFKGKKRRNPISFFRMVITAMGFFYFGLVSILLSILILFFKLLPVKVSKKKYWYRCLACFACKILMNVSDLFIPKKVEGINKRTFEKPSVIISNHQSLLDLLRFMSFTPKIVIMVSGWVWNNFFTGQLVRYAGHINVERNYRDTLPALRRALEEGNSILIFPEGTRTRTGKIRRFHKGAFYFAEQLKADITAIIFHGYYEILPPGCYVGRFYQVNYRLLGRFRYDKFGDNYSQRAKAYCSMYRSEFEKIREEERNTEFYRNELLNKYRFKGPVMEYYVKIKLKLENNYKLFDELIPRNAKIFDGGCGMGMLANMLSLTGKDRFIKGVDYDEEKIDVARYTLSEEQNNIDFECADITFYQPGFYDVFILYDVLHYISTERQKQLIEKYIDRLNPGGMVIIREGNKDIRKKHTLTVLSEFFSTGFGFNKTKHKLSFISGSMIQQIAEEKNMSFQVKDYLKATSNQVFILRNNAV